MPKYKPNTIWIDGDACPKAVKEIIFKSGIRLKIKIVLVANSYQFSRAAYLFLANNKIANPGFIPRISGQAMADFTP